MLVSPSLAARLPVLTIASLSGIPFASPDTMDHSPSSCAISFLTASSAAAVATTLKTTINEIAKRMMIRLGKKSELFEIGKVHTLSEIKVLIYLVNAKAHLRLLRGLGTKLS